MSNQRVILYFLPGQFPGTTNKASGKDEMLANHQPPKAGKEAVVAHTNDGGAYQGCQVAPDCHPADAASCVTRGNSIERPIAYQRRAQHPHKEIDIMAGAVKKQAGHPAWQKHQSDPQAGGNPGNHPQIAARKRRCWYISRMAGSC